MNSHAQYDVAIDGVPFFLGPNQELPYLRGPQQMQRQQIDSTSEAGEQSFTSWWYRSQTSFHYGQGEKFFDRSTEGLMNVKQYQFYDSAGVDVWKKDNVRLLKDTELVGFKDDMLTNQAGWGQLTGWAYSNNSGIIFEGGATFDDPDSKNDKLFVAVYNPETGGMRNAREITWYDPDGSNNDADDPPNGIQDLCVSGTQWFVMSDNGIYTGRLPDFDEDNSPIYSVMDGTRIFRFPFKWDADRGRIRMMKDSLVICAGNVVWVTMQHPDLETMRKQKALEPDGKAHFLAEFRTQKEMEEKWEPDEVPDDIPQGVSDEGWAGDGYSRVLLVHDDPAYVWNGIAEGRDGFFFSGYAGAPNQIHGFFAQVYATILEQDNVDSAPKWGHPFVACTLPSGEYQLNIETYVGKYLIVPTTNGVRIGAIGTEGDIRLGPLSIDRREGGDSLGFGAGAFSYWAMCDDRFAYVTGADIDGKWGCYRLDLENAIDGTGMMYPWAKDIASGRIRGSSPPESTGDYVARICPIGKTGLKAMYVKDSGVWAEHDNKWVSSGWLQTSWLRYSTWEDKIFAYLRSVMSPRSNHQGTLDVDWWNEYATSATGRLVTGHSGPNNGPAIDSNGSDMEPQVAVSYRFTIHNPDITQPGPRFLGYQLKSSPANVVQREIALPLLCYRRERLRSGRTVERSTWDRIKALEALQRSNKIVTYEDFLKGETMQVQVDSVQFIQDTPGQSSADMADPGGFLRVTLKEAVF